MSETLPDGLEAQNPNVYPDEGVPSDSYGARVADEYNQALIADFAAFGGLEYAQQRALMDNLERALTAGAHDLEVTVVNQKYVPGKGMENVSETVRIPYATYVDYLRMGGKELHDDLKFAEAMMRASEQYQADVDAIRNSIQQSGDLKLGVMGDGSPWVGSGYHSNAYRFRAEDGRDMVVNIFKPGKISRVDVHAKTMAFARGNSIPNLQHMVAASPKGDFIITELLPGKNCAMMTLDEREQITNDHIEQIARLAATMQAAGLKIDSKADNIMYDDEIGFSILDYARIRTEAAEESFADTLYYLSHLVGSAPSVVSQRDEPETAAREQALRDRYFAVIERFSPQLLEQVTSREAESLRQQNDADARREAYLARQAAQRMGEVDRA